MSNSNGSLRAFHLLEKVTVSDDAFGDNKGGECDIVKYIPGSIYKVRRLSDNKSGYAEPRHMSKSEDKP